MKKTTQSISIIVILHVVGVAGIVFGFREWILPLTPINLLLSGWLAIRHEQFNRKEVGVVVLIGLCGYLIELSGIQTGFPFGDYYYGSVLGPQIFSTPPLIGWLWLLLIIGASGYARRITSLKWLHPFIIATCMTALDYFMEPVAVELGFWTWFNNVIPLSNFVSWFMVALILSSFFVFSVDRKNNPVAEVFFLVQAVFFVTLNILIA